MSGSMLTYESDKGAYRLEGVLDEGAPPVLAQLSGEIGQSPAVAFDLASVRRINSLGVRAWVDFMKLIAGRQIAFRRCSPAFVDQLNTVSDFRGEGKIESILAPYVCESSGNVFYEELTIGKDITSGNYAALAGRPCSQCPEPLVFDDLPERYLHFLTFS
jgi:ABC-type transporter Mla MlaB component